ncbi:TonB-dependent receptor [Lutibacter sp. B1]|uniref:SusC/RagA family TonB-linked outer membrane protein n=1 Tax=Lutibacter sp. B1 TaxID=2725996 RepID=UPI001456D372|nr:TonB-dependent receptor [Lutibacter sp. B1]NLP58780.1 TonB-dependent receptor [Lutibacter sp. B1]
MKTKFNGILTLILALLVQFTFAQEKTISGTVSDESGPLPGVNVIVKGTSNGTQTDFDGNYTIKANTGDILVFSYVGMTTVEKAIGASNTINALLSSSNILEEVVIMGYGSQKKTELTGSTVQIKSDEIAQVPVASVDQVLQGKVAGLVFSGNSGTPGSTTDIRIRGISSITAGNEPLYVIDGVPMNNSNISATTSGSSLSALSSINSNNIESITVLKDASATAAYGARGANGVIVITTKTGKEGKTSFNFTSSYGFSNDATDGPDVLTGQERMELAYEAVYNTYGPIYNLANVEEAGEFYDMYLGEEYAAWREAGSPEADWDKRIKNNDAPVQEYNISATGGNEDSNFYAAFGYFKQEATVIGSEFERYTGNLNFNKNLTEKLKFSTLNSASYTYQDGLLEASSYFSSPRTVKYFMPPIEQPYNEDGTLNLNTTLPNPLWIAEEDIDDSKYTRIISNNSLEWETPIENLKFTTRANIDYIVYNYKRYRNPISGDGSSSNGYGWQAHNSNTTYVFQNSLDYTLQLNDSHKFDFKVLQEYQTNRDYYLEADADNFSDVGLTNLNTAGNPTTANSTYYDWHVASYMGTIHYAGFDSKYILDATYRREGNSRFGSDNRWGNFWSVGAAWNMHKENFLQNADFLTNLKLRASYGKTGNANISLNRYQSLLNFDADYAGEGASYPGTFGNKDLTWETSNTLDLGIDFGLFDNRISGSLAYFNRKSKDLLLDVPLSQTTGIPDSNGSIYQTKNIGEMENKGFEMEINFDIVRSEDFNLSLGGNLATNKNEVTKLAKDLNGEEINITTSTRRVESGHPVYGWYMPTWAGVDPDTGNETWYIDGKGSETTSNFNEANQVWQGESALPKLTAGLNLHVDFKGFFVDANAYYSGGNKVYEDWARYTNGTDVYSVVYYQGVDALLDRWQQPGDEGTRYGKFEYTGRPWMSHSKFLYDGDYIRLKNVTFGYDFNNEMMDTIGLDGLRVFVRGTNLYTWVKDDNLKYDPEVDATGFTSLTTPPVKSIIFGINVKF